MHPSRLVTGVPEPAGARHTESRIPELDGIRGIAILTVLLYHVFTYSMFHGHWTGLARLVDRATENGSHGVDLFFVLSGFLITGILLDTRTSAHYFRNFYMRRALRILPLYYAVLLIILACYPHSGSYVLLSFFHLTNIAPILGLTMRNGSMWSLSVEEHYYFLWPLIVRKLSLRGVAYTALFLWAAEPVLRGLAFAHVASVFPYTWFRLDGIATGALIACFMRSSRYSRGAARHAAVWLASLGLLVEIAGTPWGIRQHQTLFGAIFEFPPVDMICAAVVLWGASCSGSRQTGVLRIKALRTCGELSYCLYLSHCMIMDAYDWALQALHLAPAADFRAIAIRAAAVIAASFAAALVSRKILERPALSLKRYFEAAPAREAAYRTVA